MVRGADEEIGPFGCSAIAVDPNGRIWKTGLGFRERVGSAVRD